MGDSFIEPSSAPATNSSIIGNPEKVSCPRSRPPTRHGSFATPSPDPYGKAHETTDYLEHLTFSHPPSPSVSSNEFLQNYHGERFVNTVFDGVRLKRRRGVYLMGVRLGELRRDTERDRNVRERSKIGESDERRDI